MNPDPYNAGVPVWVQIVVGALAFVAAFLLIARDRRRPSPHGSFYDWEQDDDTVMDLFFGEIGDAHHNALASVLRAWTDQSDRLADVVSSTRPRHLSVVDQGVQSKLYPGRIPLREVASAKDTTPAA